MTLISTFLMMSFANWSRFLTKMLQLKAHKKPKKIKQLNLSHRRKQQKLRRLRKTIQLKDQALNQTNQPKFQALNQTNQSKVQEKKILKSTRQVKSVKKFVKTLKTKEDVKKKNVNYKYKQLKTQQHDEKPSTKQSVSAEKLRGNRQRTSVRLS